MESLYLLFHGGDVQFGINPYESKPESNLNPNCLTNFFPAWIWTFPKEGGQGLTPKPKLFSLSLDILKKKIRNLEMAISTRVGVGR